MEDKNKTKEQVINELTELRKRVNEFEALEANYKRTEELLRRSEKRYYSLIETIPHGIQEIDASGIIIFVNKAYNKIYGYEEGETIGKSVLDKVAIDSEREKLGDYLAMLVEDQPAPTPYFEKDLTKEGNIIDVQVAWNYKRDEKGRVVGFISVITDITERKRAKRKLLEHRNHLKSLTSQLTLLEEKERRRFATYLHDQIGQELFVLRFKLDMLRKSASSCDTAQSLNEVQKMTKRIIKNTRSLTSELSPPNHYQKDLGSSLKWLVGYFNERHKIMFNFKDDKKPKPLDEEIRIILFRMVRELLNNTVKHARAQKVKVYLRGYDEEIRVCVEDNGVGFNPSRIAFGGVKNNGFGIFSIKERLDYLGGHLEIESKPRHGTRMTVVAPLKDKKENGSAEVS